jgi:Tol biopolymer transport system component
MKTVWFDQSGKELDSINQTGDSRNPRLSPDDSRIAVQRTDAGGRSDVWVIDVVRGTNTRLTFNTADETYPMWTPDGSRIVYSSNQNGKFDLYQIAAGGAGNEEPLFKSDQDKLPVDWSPDGKFLLFRTNDPKTGNDLWILPATGDKKPFPFVQTPFTDGWGSFSPDGKWIAYSSDESGTMQIYVQPFPSTGNKWQVSVDNGFTPLWRRDGKQLFFLTADNRVMVVDVDLGTKFQAGVPQRLFQVPGLAPIGTALRASVTRDGRFLLVTNGATAESPLTVLLNWTAALKN